MPQHRLDADIIVVGAGPSGLVVSCEAVLGGARVLTLEKRNGPTWSRAGTLYPRVMELFASRGIADMFLSRSLELHSEPRSYKGIWAGLFPLHYDRLDTEFPYVLFMPQIETEKLLAKHLMNLGGDLRLQHEVLSHEQSADAVSVRVRTPDGEERVFRGRYLVGADGRRSVVREGAGIEYVGHEAQRTAVNVDALIDFPLDSITSVIHNEAGWGMAYPLRAGLTRFVVIDDATCRRAELSAPDLDEALAMLRRVHKTDYGIKEVHAITRFHDAMFLASKMRDRRVFLVGESVRVHYPAAGVGMQFCIQDAFNLGWKLAAVVTGTCEECLLETFERERGPQVARLMEDVRRQCALQFNFDPEHLALKRFVEQELMPMPSVNLRLCENLSGLAVRYPAPEGSHPIVGARMPDIPVCGADPRGSSVFGLLADQRFVLLDLTGDDVSGIGTLSNRLISAGVPAKPTHPDVKDLGVVLLRPDGHVAWAGRQGLRHHLPLEEIRRWIRQPLPI